MGKFDKKSLKIAFTGPECSGKTTLSKWLADKLKSPWVEEYARTYLLEKRFYGQNDLTIIAKEQSNLENLGMKANPKFLVCDTDILSIKVWSQLKYGSIYNEVELLYQRQDYDFVFLCKPDFEWFPDPLREAPEQRERLRIFEYFLKILRQNKTQFQVLEGTLESRKQKLTQFSLQIGNPI
jgi:NadR type nicotinamide-nucleotide adenylyltransferase